MLFMRSRISRLSQMKSGPSGLCKGRLASEEEGAEQNLTPSTRSETTLLFTSLLFNMGRLNPGNQKGKPIGVTHLHTTASCEGNPPPCQTIKSSACMIKPCPCTQGNLLGFSQGKNCIPKVLSIHGLPCLICWWFLGWLLASFDFALTLNWLVCTDLTDLPFEFCIKFGWGRNMLSFTKLAALHAFKTISWVTNTTTFAIISLSPTFH